MESQKLTAAYFGQKTGNITAQTAKNAQPTADQLQ